MSALCEMCGLAEAQCPNCDGCLIVDTEDAIPATIVVRNGRARVEINGILPNGMLSVPGDTPAHITLARRPADEREVKDG